MALAAGTKLGQYEVRELIGQGGMGDPSARGNGDFTLDRPGGLHASQLNF